MYKLKEDESLPHHNQNTISCLQSDKMGKKLEIVL